MLLTGRAGASILAWRGASAGAGAASAGGGSRGVSGMGSTASGPGSGKAPLSICGGASNLSSGGDSGGGSSRGRGADSSAPEVGTDDTGEESLSSAANESSTAERSSVARSTRRTLPIHSASSAASAQWIATDSANARIIDRITRLRRASGSLPSRRRTP